MLSFWCCWVVVLMYCGFMFVKLLLSVFGFFILVCVCWFCLCCLVVWLVFVWCGVRLVVGCLVVGWFGWCCLLFCVCCRLLFFSRLIVVVRLVVIGGGFFCVVLVFWVWFWCLWWLCWFWLMFFFSRCWCLVWWWWWFFLLVLFMWWVCWFFLFLFCWVCCYLLFFCCCSCIVCCRVGVCLVWFCWWCCWWLLGRFIGWCRVCCCDVFRFRCWICIWNVLMLRLKCLIVSLFRRLVSGVWLNVSCVLFVMFCSVGWRCVLRSLVWLVRCLVRVRCVWLWFWRLVNWGCGIGIWRVVGFSIFILRWFLVMLGMVLRIIVGWLKVFILVICCVFVVFLLNILRGVVSCIGWSIVCVIGRVVGVGWRIVVGLWFVICGDGWCGCLVCVVILVCVSVWKSSSNWLW